MDWFWGILLLVAGSALVFVLYGVWWLQYHLDEFQDDYYSSERPR